MNVYTFLGQNAFWSVNKKIARRTSVNASLLLSDLISKRQYFIQNKDLNQYDWFFNTVKNIEIDTTLSKYQQARAVKELEDAGFLKTKFKGTPRKRFFKILDDEIVSFMQSDEGDKGVDHKKSKNLTTRSKKTSPQEVKKLNSFINDNKEEEQTNKNKQKNSSSEVVFSFFSVDKCIYAIENGDSIPLNKITEETKYELVSKGYHVSESTQTISNLPF